MEKNHRTTKTPYSKHILPVPFPCTITRIMIFMQKQRAFSCPLSLPQERMNDYKIYKIIKTTTFFCLQWCLLSSSSSSYLLLLLFFFFFWRTRRKLLTRLANHGYSLYLAHSILFSAVLESIGSPQLSTQYWKKNWDLPSWIFERFNAEKSDTWVSQGCLLSFPPFSPLWSLQGAERGRTLGIRLMQKVEKSISAI